MEVILWATVLATATVCVVIACRLLLRSRTKGLGPGEVSQNSHSCLLRAEPRPHLTSTAFEARLSHEKLESGFAKLSHITDSLWIPLLSSLSMEISL